MRKWQDEYWNDMMAVNAFGIWLLEQIEEQNKIDKTDLHNFLVDHMNEYPNKMVVKYQSSGETANETV